MQFNFSLPNALFTVSVVAVAVSLALVYLTTTAENRAAQIVQHVTELNQVLTQRLDLLVERVAYLNAHIAILNHDLPPKSD